jgi:plasmid stability protein
MKNVTIALDDETHRAARIRAAEMGTSLSALVKDYLQSLCESPVETGVRDMAMTFAAQPASFDATLVPNPNNAPYFVDGKWVFTKDGKPRKPGALRDMWVADDFDEWPDGFIDAMYGEDTEAANNWWKPFAKPPAKPKAK